MNHDKLVSNVKLKYEMFSNPKTSLPNLSENQLNVLMYVLTILKDKQTSTVRIPLDDFLNMLKVGTNKRLSRHETSDLVTKTLNTFMSQLIQQVTDTDDLYEITSMRLFERVSWDKNHDILTMAAAQEFVPMLNELTSHFVEFPFREYLEIQGKYLKRLYFELAKYKGLKVGTATFNYDDFVKLLKISKTTVKANQVFVRVLNKSAIEELQKYFPDLDYSVERINRKPYTITFTWDAPRTRYRFDKAIRDNKAYSKKLTDITLVTNEGILGNVLTMLEMDGTVDELNNEVTLNHEARHEVYSYVSQNWLTEPEPMTVRDLINRLFEHYGTSIFNIKQTKPVTVKQVDNYVVPEKYMYAVTDAKKYLPLRYLKTLKTDMGGMVIPSESNLVSDLTKNQKNLTDEVINMLIWYELVEHNQPAIRIDVAYQIANKWLMKKIVTAEQAVKYIDEYEKNRRDSNNQKDAEYFSTPVPEPTVMAGTYNYDAPLNVMNGQEDVELGYLHEKLDTLKGIKTNPWE